MTSTPTRPVDNVVMTTKGLQDRNINILAGTTVENKGKLILTVLLLCYKEFHFLATHLTQECIDGKFSGWLFCPVFLEFVVWVLFFDDMFLYNFVI